MTTKRRVPNTDLLIAYKEQWAFLRRSCAAYDAGETAEAKRLAATLRLLLHDTKHSKSLLSQLGLKKTLFFDTSANINEDNLLPTFGLVQAHVSHAGSNFVPPLDRPIGHPVWMIPFEYWWNKRVIRIPRLLELTRAELVLTMADQDGGAHVDSEMEERYYRLTRENAIGYQFTDSRGRSIPIGGLEGASVRQIAQEVLASLVTPRRMIPPNLAREAHPTHVSVMFDARTGQTEQRILPVRDICPCNSGLEYDQCHAWGGMNEGKLVKPRVT